LYRSYKFIISKDWGLHMWDVFISHASEDKPFVRQLAQALQAQGVRVWFDEMTLKLGDRLGESIDRGLAESRYGIVVFSQAFFNKQWPRYESEGMLNKEMAHGKTILPVWHNVSASDVANYSYSLANKVAVSTTSGLDHVVTQILDVVKPSTSSSPSRPATPNNDPTPSPTQPQTQIDQKKLRELMLSSFNISELKTLTDDLGEVFYEDLGGEGRSDKVRELIGFMDRRGRLQELVDAVRKERPHLFL
ncbi:MAG: TIR domain-containing protein, partial [Chloroflexota bacterium]